MYFDLNVCCSPMFLHLPRFSQPRNVWFQCLHGEQTRAAYLDLGRRSQEGPLSMVVDGEKTWNFTSRSSRFVITWSLKRPRSACSDVPATKDQKGRKSTEDVSKKKNAIENQHDKLGRQISGIGIHMNMTLFFSRHWMVGNCQNSVYLPRLCCFVNRGSHHCLALQRIGGLGWHTKNHMYVLKQQDHHQQQQQQQQ